MMIETTVNVWQEGRQFVAHAMPLDVMSSGNTPQAARVALDEAVHLFLESAKEAGTLEELLLECGYEQQGDHWTSPRFVSVERQAVALAG